MLPEPGDASAPGIIVSFNATTARSNDATVPSELGIATDEAVASAGQGSSPPSVAGMLEIREVGHGNGRGALV